MDEQTILGIGSRVKHPEFGSGVIIQVKPEAYVVTFIDSGIKDISKEFGELEIIEAVEPPVDLVSWQEIEERFVKLMRKITDIQETVPMADKWRGGKLILQPADTTKSSKEMLIDTFFHKIVMIRDRVRVMEQRINSSNLTDDEKINLEQYITRIYGTLTSFNVLFKNRKDSFATSAR